ncbi:serine/threonine protein phosphatase [Tabrizicola sp. TH137]|uniref:metallophosphoesterase n=1 Tax=Tabrizicola sp. TH137 TaxID=2067452 RepID=UPI000C7B1F3B|nr:metallophosphoesterase [Tabrizicola sp. TH137]PLL12058.1 serine/threonine protein phosphatase [Tabrizicola sp. TH137]
MRSYAIGDIHGHLDLLLHAHDLIAEDRRQTGDHDAPVIHLGDYVDRGPDCRGVVDYLAKGTERGENWVTLKGNHDRMFTRFLRDPFEPEEGLRAELSWLHPRLGGAATLASYGVRSAADRPLVPVHSEAVEAVPEAHRIFLDSRPTWHQRGECVFVHAGIRPGIPMPAQTETDLVWIRGGFLEDTRDHGFLVVHGHTALDHPTHYGNRLNIDSSAAYGGPLTAVVIEGRDVWLLTDWGREPLQP